MKYLNKLPNHKYPWLPVLYGLVYSLRPKRIVEFGTEHGGTSIVMTPTLADLLQNFGHVGCISTFDTYGIESEGHIGSCPNYDLAVRNINNKNMYSLEF